MDKSHKNLNEIHKISQRKQLILVFKITILELLFSIIAILLIYLNPYLALIVFFFLFQPIMIILLYISLKEYKVKYLFNKKEYKKQLIKYLKYTSNNPQIKKIQIKTAKDAYRRTGDCNNHIRLTPLSLLFDFYAIYPSMGNLFMDGEIYIVCVLYDYINSGGGLYRVFEDLSNFFTFEEYIDLIKKSNLFSDEIKEVLTSPKYEPFYNQLKCDQGDDEISSEFENLYSNQLDKYQNEINEIFKEVAIEHYLDKYKFANLPQDRIIEMYLRFDKRKRFFILKDKNTEIYKIRIDEFIFEKDDNCKDELQLEGYWVLKEIIELKTLDETTNINKEKLDNYAKIDIDKLMD